MFTEIKVEIRQILDFSPVCNKFTPQNLNGDLDHNMLLFNIFYFSAIGTWYIDDFDSG